MSIKSPPPPPPTSTTASLRNKNVNFSSHGEDEKEREKYLTAKYGAHQMSLIRKRLKVEMWMFDQLQEMQDCQTDNTKDFEIDLDEVLDIEDDLERRIFIRKLLTDSTSSKEIIN